MVTVGIVSPGAMGSAVGRVLATKFRLGLFEQPFAAPARIELHTRSATQLELARRIAADSLVLLKNDGVLPLAAPASVAVLGPNAASRRAPLGDYSYVAHVESLADVLRSGGNVFAMPVGDGIDIDADGTTDLGHVATVLDELRDRLPGVAVTHAEGCAVSGDDRSGFDDAVAAAAAADVAVLVAGDLSGLTTECTSGESRDVSSLALPGVQEDLVLAVAATGTPVVLVLVAGRPTGTPAVHEAAAAVLMAWLPGEQGAGAIVDALTGAASPGGKLPVSFPRSSGQIPVFHGHKVSGGRSHWKGEYVDLSNEPLYPFGYGLSYSTFELDVEHLDERLVAPGDVIEVGATIINVGTCTADEVVQLYSCDPVASITRPVRELQGFARVTLAAGERADVTFGVPFEALGFTGRDMTYAVEPGEVRFLVGTSSAELQPAGHVIVGGTAPVQVPRAGSARVSITR